MLVDSVCLRAIIALCGLLLRRDYNYVYVGTYLPTYFGHSRSLFLPHS